LKKKLIEIIIELKDQKKFVTFLRLDDAGENFALERACQQLNLGVKFEFSGPRTPQRNGKVERKFQTLYGRIRAMFNGSGISDDLRHGLWAECASTACFYENRIINKEKFRSPLQLMFKQSLKGLNNLRPFGDMYVVTTKNKIQGKLSDKGTTGIFVGYPKNHADDVYRIFNTITKKIIKSRDVLWLNMKYGDWMISNKEIPKHLDDDSLSFLISKDGAKNLAAEDEACDEVKDAKFERAMRETSRLKS